MKHLITHLENELRTRDDGYVQRSEEILGQITRLHDPSSIGLLLPLLDDHAEYDELMFSIVHAIEDFDDETYVRELLQHTPEFWSNSPRWATLIQKRILNSQPTLLAYQAGLKGLADRGRQSVREVLLDIRQQDAKFTVRVDTLLALLGT